VNKNYDSEGRKVLQLPYRYGTIDWAKILLIIILNYELGIDPARYLPIMLTGMKIVARDEISLLKSKEVLGGEQKHHFGQH
jgi:hypothetical protein